MNYLFKTEIWFVGQSGCFEVYEMNDSQFFCKMVYWDSENENGPGDVTVWRTKKKWKINKDVYPHLKLTLATNIEKYLMDYK